MCQFTDHGGRPTLKNYINEPGVYAVGRLDFDSEGLVLLTDDGELNHLLSSPKNKQFKTYWVQVEGIPSKEMLNKIISGVVIQKEKTLPAEVKILPENLNVGERPKPIRFRKNIPTSWLEVRICEGRNHQVKKMTASVGLPCLRLIRVGIGPVEMGDLKPGEFKYIQSFL